MKTIKWILLYFDKILRHNKEVIGAILLLFFLLILVFFLIRKTLVFSWLKKRAQAIYNVVSCFALLIFTILGVLLIYSLGTISIEDIGGVYLFAQQDNLYNASGCEDFFYDYDGNIIPSQNGSVMSNWISCEAGESLTRNGFATNVVVYFDKDRNFITRIDSLGQATVTVPNDTRIKYVRMAVQPSDERMIVRGESLHTAVETGDYIEIPELRVTQRNMLQDSLVLHSPDGKEWRITVDPNGNLITKDVSDIVIDLPADFPTYKVIGKGSSEEDYLMAMYPSNYKDDHYIFIMSNEGDVKWYKKVSPYAYNFRKIEYKDGTIRYAYQEVIGAIGKTNTGVFATKVVLLDEELNLINDNIMPIMHGSIPSNEHGCETHDYIVIDDNHFILTAATESIVTNVPGFEGKKVYVVNDIIQEQKDGEVIMQWESIDDPELYVASIYNNDYSESSLLDYKDYVHINSIAVDPKNYDLLISCRSIGLMKISRDSGKTIWIMGRNHNDIKGISDEQIGLYQHDARYTDDGSITIFDNQDGKDCFSRVCRYWINEESLEASGYKEYITPYKSVAMGSAKLIDEESETYLISYGTGTSDFGFEERSFANGGKVNMQLKFGENGDNVLYRIFNGIERIPQK